MQNSATSTESTTHMQETHLLQNCHAPQGGRLVKQMELIKVYGYFSKNLLMAFHRPAAPIKWHVTLLLFYMSEITCVYGVLNGSIECSGN